MAARESRCNKGVEVWSSERKGSDRPIDLSGRNEGSREPPGILIVPMWLPARAAATRAWKCGRASARAVTGRST
ncbi:hypothetical protein C7E25_24125 [Stenotrophomonas maltophilia]|nr:hypothetical protein C7E25_24125 [Stenotrophomonas maltophilia]